MKRCTWANLQNPLYVHYHDQEWGVPVVDDRTLFEFIVLESAQAGLSWETVLNKREAYRTVFHDFDIERVARMTDEDVLRLLADPGIVRNRLKVASAITNARAFLEIQQSFGTFAQYLWNMVGGVPIVRHDATHHTETELSRLLAKDLKKRGFSFMGPTIVYAYLQAVGVVNDHDLECFRHTEIRQYTQGRKFP